MSDERLDAYAKKLEEMIKEEAKTHYNDYIVDLFYDPKNWGKPLDEEISVSESYKGPCNDTVEFYLKIRDGIIERANFTTDGCGATIATASQVTMLIEGKPLEYAEKLKPEVINEALGGLPEDHKHCALLTTTTLLNAIQKYKRKIDK